MKSSAEVLRSEPILVDRTAHTFGTEGERFRVRSNGVLTLFEDHVLFEHVLTGTRIVIPITDVEGISIGVRHRRHKLEHLLKITYRGNLLFAVAVARPQSWLNALESLTARQGRSPHVDHSLPVAERMPRIKVLIGFALIFVLILTVVLPLLFSWVHLKTVRQSRPETPATQPTGTSG
jgi:hypothetical protein